MRVIKVNLSCRQERERYSCELCAFECDFSYPLGDTSFVLSHGSDYFKFFEALGQPVDYYIIKDNGIIVAALCCVLRDFGDFKSWYICDYKVRKEYRGKKLYRKFFIRYFLSHYLRCPYFFFVNMSAPENNKIISYAQKIFKFLPLQYEKMYLSQWNSTQCDNLPPGQYQVVKAIKNIVIDHKLVPLYHLRVLPDTSLHAIAVSSALSQMTSQLPPDAKIMFLNHLSGEEISLVFKGPKPSISSAEI